MALARVGKQHLLWTPNRAELNRIMQSIRVRAYSDADSRAKLRASSDILSKGTLQEIVEYVLLKKERETGLYSSNSDLTSFARNVRLDLAFRGLLQKVLPYATPADDIEKPSDKNSK